MISGCSGRAIVSVTSVVVVTFVVVITAVVVSIGAVSIGTAISESSVLVVTVVVSTVVSDSIACSTGLIFFFSSLYRIPLLIPIPATRTIAIAATIFLFFHGAVAVLSGGVVVVVDWVGSASSNIGASAVVCSFGSSKAGCNIIFCSGSSEKEICSSCNSSCISGSACQPFSIKLLFPQYLHFLLSSCKDLPHWLQNILDTPLYPIFTIGSNRKGFLIDCNQGDEKKTKNHKQNDHYNY